MFFSNLVGNELVGIIDRNKGKSFPLVVADANSSSASVRLSNNSLRITIDDSGKNIFDIDSLDRVYFPKTEGLVGQFSFEEVADTDENPLVVVATKGIKFYVDIPTFVEILLVNDNVMIVCLVYGACEFELEDGSFVPLQRCNDDDLDRKAIYGYYSCSVLKDNVWCKTKGGWDKSYELVIPFYMQAIKKSDRVDAVYRTVGDKAYIFNPQGIKDREDYELKREEEAKLKKELAKKEADERRRAAEARAAKEREEAAVAKRREMEAKATSKSKKINSISSSGRNAGAEAFLAMLNGMK